MSMHNLRDRAFVWGESVEQVSNASPGLLDGTSVFLTQRHKNQEGAPAKAQPETCFVQIARYTRGTEMNSCNAP